MKAVFFIFLLASSAAISQTAARDSTAGDKRFGVEPFTASSLAQQLTKPFDTELGKVSSIFTWITGNIAYDTKGYYNLDNIYKGLYHPDVSPDSVTVFKNYNDNIVQKVLVERVAICDGYTRLFKTLCDEANIRSEIVLGYVRWHTDPIGVQIKRIHAWNAVQIESQWYLLDPTWASGYSNTDVTAFNRDYDPFYFLTPPDQLINDHYPLDSRWQLRATPVTQDGFYRQPYLFSAFRKFKVSSYKPETGIIERAVGEKILFEIETVEPESQMVVLESLVADSSEMANPKNIVTGNRVGCEYILKEPGTKTLNVVYKGQPVLRYQVRVKDNPHEGENANSVRLE